VKWRTAPVVADADYGDNPHFLNGLEARREKYVVAVRSDFRVTLGGRTSCPVARIDDLLATQPRSAWRTLTWSAGSRGRLRAKFLALRGSRVDGDGRQHRGWLIGQRPGRGQCGEGRYFWSNFPPAASLEAMAEYTHRRHWIEQYHEEAKTELGSRSVSGPAVGWFPSARGGRHAEFQFPGLARMASAAGAERARTASRCFFPRGQIAGECRCRKCIAASASGCAVKRFEN
jgi:hypothetical protein